MSEIVTISSGGTITLPIAVRDALDLKADDQLVLETIGQSILLRPAATLPIEVYTEERIAEFAADEDELGSLLPRKE